jgi:endoglucanase
MKRIKLVPLLFAFYFLLSAIGCANTDSGLTITGIETKYGPLSVQDGTLSDESGKPVQIKGMSTNSLYLVYELINPKTFDTLKYDWKADVVRIAMWVGDIGYNRNPEKLMEILENGIKLAIERGLYVIVDWHVLRPGNPNDPVYEKAEDFFTYISKKYGKYENIIYEIMNEPNGDVTWQKDLKPYAQKMVKLIRKYDPDNLILVGSGTWSQDVNIAAADPVEGENLMYTVHFYSGSHGAGLRLKIDQALKKGVGVFCSEWGTSKANGTDGTFLKEADKWLDFFDKKNISWVNWSLANIVETSSALMHKHPALDENGKPTGETIPSTPLVPQQVNDEGVPYWPEEQLTPSGVYVRAKMRGE